MNFLKKGPELKLSEIKVPGFLEDVYYDLKDRHLLPVAAILLVAIIAIPFALGGSDSPEGSEGAEPGASISSTPPGSDLAVARAAPGLREYDRRLDHLQAKNPFKQQYTGATGSGKGEAAGGSGGTEGPSASGSGGSESSEPSSPSPSYTPPSEPGDEGSASEEPTYYSYAIDVRVSGGTKDKKASVRRDLLTLTMLPSRETPAIVYMGATKDGKKAVMTVSSDVRSIFGDAKCVLGSQSCQLLAMEPGLPETFVYGGAEKTYKIEILKIHLVKSDELNKAPLGDPEKNQGAGKSKRQTLAAEAVQPR